MRKFVTAPLRAPSLTVCGRSKQLRYRAFELFNQVKRHNETVVCWLWEAPVRLIKGNDRPLEEGGGSLGKAFTGRCHRFVTETQTTPAIFVGTLEAGNPSTSDKCGL